MSADDLEVMCRALDPSCVAPRVEPAVEAGSAIKKMRHPREGGDLVPSPIPGESRWVPAFAGMTVEMMPAAFEPSAHCVMAASCFSASAIASAFGSLPLTHPSRKARRASQEARAEEARMSERSEFRAVPWLPRSAGDRRTAAACVPAGTVSLGTSLCLALRAGFAVLHRSCGAVPTFAKTKVGRALGRESSCSCACTEHRRGAFA
jgi:hypothetical protein